MKNKTIAAWLAFLGGPFGLHRFYLHGMGDWLAWLHPIPTALGVYGIERALTLGQDDRLSWLLIPIVGFHFSACALTAIILGLSSTEQWNARYNPGAPEQATAGATNWFTILAVAGALMVGAAVLMASIAFSFQRYFENQVEQARQISQ